MIASILFKAHPDDVKLILIDPKIIEFSNYEDIPHLATPVITEPKVAAAALKWAVEEMENRYQLFRSLRVREYEEYSKVAANNLEVKHIPYIVIIIDELADLMLVAGNDVEDYIQRLTQKGRASGIHLIIATQRPSVDVIKGTIKTNIPTRIAFLVKTQVDSSIILDHSGAEKLLGNGDMLYNDSVSEQRVQGAFISPKEIKDITNFIRNNCNTDFIFTSEDLQEKMDNNTNFNDGINDEYFQIIARYVVENQNASINRIQKTFGIGFNRAQAIIQGLEELGIVSENLGSRARTVQVNLEQLEGILDEL
jgi:S-DNA-T family DNA segregation ATPase FtsK/SpoIIIE